MFTFMQSQETDQAGNGQADRTIDVDVVAALMEQLEGYLQAFVKSLPNIAMAIVILLIVWAISKGVRRVLGRALGAAQVRPALVDLTQTLANVVIWVLGILITMSILFPSVKPSSILAALGVGGIAIGFAFKDIFENFMAGAMIMLRKPMQIGDLIECEGVEGKIQDIQIRDTYVRQNDGQLVLVPNAMLYKNPVYIRTEPELRRYSIVAGVGYDVDVDAARDVIHEAVEKLDIVSKDKGVDVFAREFNSSSVDFTVRWWTDSEQRRMHESRDQVIASIKRALEDADMEIPYPYRTLTFKEPLETREAAGA